MIYIIYLIKTKKNRDSIAHTHFLALSAGLRVVHVFGSSVSYWSAELSVSFVIGHGDD